MFKWARTKEKTPKTPKMPSVSLPDERYTPIKSHIEYLEKPRAPTYVRRHTQDYRGTTPMVDQWAPHAPTATGRSRSRTLSTPVHDVHAPRPIRPHPSQGGFIPIMEPTDRIRRNSSRGPMMPVGVPSAAYLEEQIRRSQMEDRAPPPFEEEEDSDPEVRRLKEVAKRNGVKVYSHPSKAWLDEMTEKQERANEAKNPAKKSKSSPKQKIYDRATGKELLDLDDWGAVPLNDEGIHMPVTNDLTVPLKSALKKSSPPRQTPAPAQQRPALKSALKKKLEPSPESVNAYYSENEIARRQSKYGDRTRVIETASKAFLEEQQEKLNKVKERGWASNPPAPATRQPWPSQNPVHNSHRNSFHTPQPPRPQGYWYTASSSTGSPTDIPAPIIYDSFGRPVQNYLSLQVSSYMVPFLRGPPPIPFKDNRPKYGPSETTYHGVLSWPMVDYGLRRHDKFPYIYYDVAYDPADIKHPLKARRDVHNSPLTREEKDTPVAHYLHLNEMWIVNRQLNIWPLHIKSPNEKQALRVIDVFRAIHKHFVQRLTGQDVAHFGEENVRACTASFKHRCENSSQFVHVEERRGMIRLDLLRGRRAFKGLVPIPGMPFHYELLFDDIRPS